MGVKGIRDIGDNLGDLAQGGGIAPLLAYYNQLFGNKGGNAAASHNSIQSTLSSMLQPMRAFAPGSIGRIRGGRGSSGPGGMGVSSLGKSGPDYGEIATSRDFERRQRKLDSELEREVEQRALMDRVKMIRELFGSGFGQETGMQETLERQAGDLVKVPLQSSRSRDITSLISQLLR